MNSFQELLFYRLYRTLTGDLAPVDVYRHNGKPAVRCVDPEPHLTRDLSPNVWAMVSENLTPIERRTWWKLAGGRSIASIATEEGTSRTAIYIRIRGKNGRGGMIAKNAFVRAWWLRRQDTLQ